MVIRRQRYDAMQPVDHVTWLVVQDEAARPLSIEELPRMTDPRMVMVRAMAKSIGEGWEIEELPGVRPVYFCRKGNERRCVTIMHYHPADRRWAPT